MENYKIDFIECALQAKVLQFGEFKLASGRISPYFFNAGLFNKAQETVRVGNAYVGAIRHYHIPCDTMFGPAYKGIPLAMAAHAAIAPYQPDIAYCCNRKEQKDHGDGGMVVGAPPGRQSLIIDDVITSGTSIRKAIDFIRENGGDVCGALILVDRMEKGLASELSAVQEVQQDFGIRVYSVITLEDILQYADSNSEYAAHVHKIEAYRQQYGVR